MNTSIYIAKRYLFSKKSLNAINFISGISMLGVFVGSAALILILSVFNGFELLVLSMYDTFTPELKIEPALGKTYETNTAYFKDLRRDARIENFTEVLQEKVLIKYGKSQHIGVIKGVSDDFAKNRALDSALINGSFKLKHNGEDLAVVGSQVQAYLTVNVSDDFEDLQIFTPNKKVKNASNPADEFIVRAIHPVGVLEVHQEYDDIVLVPIGFARDLLNEPLKASSIEINLKPGVSLKSLKNELSKTLGKNFIVKDRFQQNELLYKILNSEKWAIFVILTFILIIAIFNIIGSLTMLVIDKRRDIAILSSLGADNSFIRNIFFTEGMMISMIGCFAGMFIGLIFALIQQKYGVISMGQFDMIIDSYPVDLKISDFVLVFITVLVISSLASFISSRLSIKNITNLREDL
ncbi:MAG TPA: FtsX-like permease family protein [Sphingobacteriaceae bacterium]|nr:FtsX-like permease family protein [Sphingobacteriaceae bacterium]